MTLIVAFDIVSKSAATLVVCDEMHIISTEINNENLAKISSLIDGQGSKLTLASSHFASEFHQTASAKLYHTHFSATRTLALIIHDSHQNSV